MPKILKNKDDGDKKDFRKQSSRHDPIARPTLLAQIEGEDMKTRQPRGNKKRKVKQRIYEKLKKSTADEQNDGADQDNFEDIADENVVRQAQLQAMDIREEESARNLEGEDEDDDGLSYDSDDAQTTYSAKSGIDDYQHYLEEEQLITEEEEAAFNSFLNPTSAKIRTIADLIEEKLQQKRAAGDVSNPSGMLFVVSFA
jgi:hypothetical protein